MQRSINIAVVGLGYWGPNIVRNFYSVENARVVSVCDKESKALRRTERYYPGIKTTTDYDDIVSSSEVDAIAIVTPVSTHYELAIKALKNGKHVFIEKPFTSTVDQAKELIEIADRKNLIIMVDHTFLFTGAVKKIKEIVDDNILGELYYYDSTRINLGLFQHDVNVIWDLAPHDFSIMDYIVNEKVEAIMATGKKHFCNGFEDVAFVTVYFTNKLIGHFNINWISPVKIRTTLIGGEKKMLVWNDLEADEKVKVYDKGVKIENREGVYDLLVRYRSGDMWAPRVEQFEALKVETEYFIDCVLNNQVPFNDGRAGLRIIKILEATNESLKYNGKMIKL